MEWTSPWGLAPPTPLVPGPNSNLQGGLFTTSVEEPAWGDGQESSTFTSWSSNVNGGNHGSEENPVEDTARSPDITKFADFSRAENSTVWDEAQNIEDEPQSTFSIRSANDLVETPYKFRGSLEDVHDGRNEDVKNPSKGGPVFDDQGHDEAQNVGFTSGWTTIGIPDEMFAVTAEDVNGLEDLDSKNSGTYKRPGALLEDTDQAGEDPISDVGHLDIYKTNAGGFSSVDIQSAHLEHDGFDTATNSAWSEDQTVTQRNVSAFSRAEASFPDVPHATSKGKALEIDGHHDTTDSLPLEDENDFGDFEEFSQSFKPIDIPASQPDVEHLLRTAKPLEESPAPIKSLANLQTDPSTAPYSLDHAAVQQFLEDFIDPLATTNTSFEDKEEISTSHVRFPQSNSAMDELFPVSVDPADGPPLIDDNLISSTSQRKAWYLISRAGTMREYESGDFERYMRVKWQGSAVQARVGSIVSRWIAEDRMGGGGGTFDAHAKSLGVVNFNWAATVPMEILSEEQSMVVNQVVEDLPDFSFMYT